MAYLSMCSDIFPCALNDRDGNTTKNGCKFAVLIVLYIVLSREIVSRTAITAHSEALPNGVRGVEVPPHAA